MVAKDGSVRSNFSREKVRLWYRREKRYWQAMVSDVVIAGAGIAGLTLAIALGRRGVRVRCLERMSDLKPAGAGLALPPNAVRRLGQLGLEIAAEGNVILEAAILDRDGRKVGGATNVADVARTIGAPMVAMHRSRLHALLRKAVNSDVVRTDSVVVGYAEHGDRVVARCADGKEVSADLLIGADGLRSAIRAQLVNDGEPRYAGYTSWRGVTPAGSVPAPTRVSETWGRGERFGIVDIGFGELYWFACANAPVGGQDQDVQTDLLKRFGRWHQPIATIIRATPPANILRTDINDRRPIRNWHRGRVVLVGDAAHPMTPDLGQGAGQAIEDAVILDECLSQHTGIETALRAFERRRLARANTMVRMSRRMGMVAQWENPPAASLRNTLMRLVPTSLANRQMLKLMRER